MPRPSRQPSYRLHKARRCAVVTLDGKNHYLGPYGSPESHQKYARLIAEWKRNGGLTADPDGQDGSLPKITVAELILAYFRHAQTYYLKNGKPTSEQGNLRQALRFARRLYG